MNTFAKVRQWINRNDGRYFQVENEQYSLPHAVGLVLLIPGVIVATHSLPEALENPPPSSVGWGFIVVGLSLIVFGRYRGNK